MKYEYVGKKTHLYGKTLWEIVGNLKNFGVGRYVTTSYGARKPKLCFFKIVKVQPVPPPKKQFQDRNVMVWFETVWNNRLLGVIPTYRYNYMAKFQLISKEKEKVLLEKLKNTKPPVVHLKKYITWPPLYKIMWEKSAKTSPGSENYEAIPKLKAIHEDYIGCKVIEDEEEIPPLTYTSNKGKPSVEEMYKEIVRLKLHIKENSPA